MMRLAGICAAVLFFTACAPMPAANTTWVYKMDGAVQCEPAPGQSLEDARSELAGLAGAENILAAERRSIMVAQVCGAPSGWVNAFELSEDGWLSLSRGIRGPGAFLPWSD